MSISPDKVYRLRAGPATGVGGLYAINDDHNNPIRLSPLIPPFVEKANWQLLPAQHEGDVYQISFVHSGPGLPVVWDVPEHPQPGRPVLASPSNLGKGWVVRPIDNGVANAYTISPNIDIIGAHWFAAPDFDSQWVIFKVLPIGIPDEEKPYWVLDVAGSE